MWRRYTPNTNRFLDPMLRTNQSPSGGRVVGIEARPPFDRILTNRTRSGRDGSLRNGFPVSSWSRSRPSQNMTSASNGSFLSNTARNRARDPGLRTTKVPAAPTLTTSNLLSARARTLGRNVRCPPTLTPRRKTMSAIPCEDGAARAAHQSQAQPAAARWRELMPGLEVFRWSMYESAAELPAPTSLARERPVVPIVVTGSTG